MAKKPDFFEKQAIRRALKDNKDFNSAGFAIGGSAIIAFGVLLASFQWKEHTFNSTGLIAVCVYFAQFLLTLLVRQLIKRDITKTGSISRGTRAFGPLLALMAFTGNIFSGAVGLLLMKKEKNLEYTMGVYVCQVDILLLLCSVTSLFKPWVPDTYFLGVGLIIGLLVIHAAAMVLAGKFVRGTQADKPMLWLGILLILTAFGGNLLALVMGVMLIAKVRNKDPEISIAWVDTTKRLFRSEMAIFGIVVAVFFISMTIFAQLTFDYDFATSNNYSAILQGPSLLYPFGTDDYGRCVFTRVVFGARISILAGIGATAVSLLVGMVFGAIAGYYSNRVDNLIMRVMDVFLAIPGLLLPIAIVTAFGTSLFCIIIALGAGCIPRFARTVRASVLGVANSEFVEAARACGARDGSILSKHILPNCLAPVIVQGTLTMATNVVTVSSLSYLGLGVSEYIPEWGNILKSGSIYLEEAPYLAIYPGIVVVLLVLAINFLGDGFRDALDPKLK